MALYGWIMIESVRGSNPSSFSTRTETRTELGTYAARKRSPDWFCPSQLLVSIASLK